MRRLWSAILVACAVVPAEAMPVRWIGAPPVDPEALRISIARMTVATPADLAERARELMAEASYFWAEVEVKTDTLLIRPGPAGLPGKITPLHDSVGGVAEVFSDALGGSTSTRAVAAAMRATVDFLVDCGYPFGQVQLSGVDISERPRVDFTIAVYPGPPVSTGDLPTFSRRTAARVFEREAGWERGRPLDGDIIERSSAGIEALPFVEQVDSARLVAVTGDTADLWLPVRESPSIRISGVAGWAPATGDAAGYWGGELDLALLSPFGDGRSVGLYASRRDPESRRAGLSVWEPWPGGIPVWVGANLRQDDFGSDFIETEATARVRVVTARPRWEVEGAWAKVTPEEEPGEFTFPARRYRAGLSVSDSLGSRGYRFLLRFSRQRLFARGGLAPPVNVLEHTQGTFSVYRWVGLARGLLVHTHALGAGTLSNSGPISTDLLYRVGGIHSLRGYREEEFLVRDYLRLALELHAGSRSQSVFALVDAAWLNHPTRGDEVVAGFGLGVRVARRLELQVAVPTRGGFEETKIHIGLSTSR